MSVDHGAGAGGPVGMTRLENLFLEVMADHQNQLNQLRRRLEVTEEILATYRYRSQDERLRSRLTGVGGKEIPTPIGHTSAPTCATTDRERFKHD